MDNNAETMTVSRVLRKGRSSLFRLVLMAGLLTLAASCSDGSVYSSRFETIAPSGWVKDKPLEFDLPDSLPATTFDIVLDVRHNNNYAYRNLWVTVDYVSHRQVVASDTVNVELADKYGNYWHASTMRISVNHDFERRVGLFPAGFDADGVLYCNQNFADYPHEIPAGKFDAASQQPKWMLLSYRKAVTASSTAEGSDPVNTVDEDCRRWWSAGSDQPGEWLCVDLGRDYDVRAIQVNMADEKLVVDFPADSYGDDRKTRHIETRLQISCYTVETSLDGKVWTLREDVARECSNGYYEYADGIRARYVRVTGGALPYGQTLRISGLRVFGNGEGACPAQANAKAVRVDALDGKISWQHIENAQGCNVRYGMAPDKLYQSWLVYDADEVTLSTLMSGQTYYICVDSFNENGVTTGEIIKMEG